MDSRAILLLQVTLLLFSSMVSAKEETFSLEDPLNYYFVKDGPPAGTQLTANYIKLPLPKAEATQTARATNTDGGFKKLSPCEIDYCHPQCGCPSEICGCK